MSDATNEQDNNQGMSFGTRLRELLGQRNISQSQLARECGLDRSEINRLCSDKRDPRAHEVVRIARALGTDANSLLDGVVLPSEFAQVRVELQRISVELLEIEQQRDSAVAALHAEREQIERERADWERERNEGQQRIVELQVAHATEIQSLQEHSAQQTRLQTDQLSKERERAATEFANAKRTAAAREQQLLLERRDAQDSERSIRGALARAVSQVKQLEATVTHLQAQISRLKGQRVVTGVIAALGGIMLGAGSAGDQDEDEDLR